MTTNFCNPRKKIFDLLISETNFRSPLFLWEGNSIHNKLSSQFIFSVEQHSNWMKWFLCGMFYNGISSGKSSTANGENQFSQLFFLWRPISIVKQFEKLIGKNGKRFGSHLSMSISITCVLRSLRIFYHLWKYPLHTTSFN